MDEPVMFADEPTTVSPVTPTQALRIVHVINEPFTPDAANGVQQVVYCLAGAQSELGHVVTVFSRTSGVHRVSWRIDPPSSNRSTANTWRVTAIRERLLSRYLERELADDLLAARPDIVHFHSVHIPQNVALAARIRRSGIRYCVTAHGGLCSAALARGRVKKTAFLVGFERRYLNEAQFIHAVSPRESEVIRRYGVEGPIVVVPNGLPPDVDVPPREPDALYRAIPWLRGRLAFMFVGRLDTRQKGLDLLVKAFAHAGLREQALVLVGPDCRGSQGMLTKLAARLGVFPQVVFTGPVFGSDRADLCAAADVFVHPSRWEGLSLSVLVAAAARKPCVITREADPLGQLEQAQAAIMVEPTVSSIAAGLRRAASLTRDELDELGRRARRVAEGHCTWSSIAEQLVTAYGSTSAA